MREDMKEVQRAIKDMENRKRKDNAKKARAKATKTGSKKRTKGKA